MFKINNKVCLLKSPNNNHFQKSNKSLSVLSKVSKGSKSLSIFQIANSTK
jgi:hypothetical protein